MSQRWVQKHDDLAVALAVIVVCAFLCIALLYFFEWNDQQWFKTLDKLTCEEIWEMMMNGNMDWDTIDYYGERC